MTTPRWDETWHRLREWTNGQAPSERLAAQVVLSDGFAGLDPSHPLGGKDGGKDAVCTRDGKRWVMAAYFPRGQQTFAAIKKKFSADLRGARSNGAEGFAFVTNQELALAQRAELTRVATPLEVEVYHLERVTTILDSPPLLKVREQFVGVAPGSTGFQGSGPYKLLLKRSAYLTNRQYDGMDWNALVEACRDLLALVGGLHLGGHFAEVLKRHIEPPWQPVGVTATVFSGDDSYIRQREAQAAAAADSLRELTETYRVKLAAALPDVATVLEEIIMAQGGSAVVLDPPRPRRRAP
jgi:hypothetical protein